MVEIKWNNSKRRAFSASRSHRANSENRLNPEFGVSEQKPGDRVFHCSAEFDGLISTQSPLIFQVKKSRTTITQAQKLTSILCHSHQCFVRVMAMGVSTPIRYYVGELIKTSSGAIGTNENGWNFSQSICEVHSCNCHILTFSCALSMGKPKAASQKSQEPARRLV